MTAEQPAREPSIPPPSGAVRWRCFHCDATFTEAQAKWAREHFGRDEGETPVCQMRVPGESGLIAALRKAQDELASYRAEDTVMMRAIESQAADYEQRCIREEEKGYARGLKDYMAVESERDAARAAVVEMRESAAKELGKIMDELNLGDPEEVFAWNRMSRALTNIRSLSVKEAIGINSRECEPMTPETANALAELARTVRDNDVRKQERERCAAKIEEQSKMLSSMFDDRHEPLCRDLAATIRSLPVKEG